MATEIVAKYVFDYLSFVFLSKARRWDVADSPGWHWAESALRWGDVSTRDARHNEDKSVVNLYVVNHTLDAT